MILLIITDAWPNAWLWLNDPTFTREAKSCMKYLIYIKNGRHVNEKLRKTTLIEVIHKNVKVH